MSNDIKIVDYIPEDRSLCAHCIFYNECPYEYICPSIERLMEYEKENGEFWTE